MTIGDATRLATDVIRCLIYVRISMDKAHDGHGVANQLAKLEHKARECGWTVVYRLSDNDIGVTRKDPTKPAKYRPGYEEAMRAAPRTPPPPPGPLPGARSRDRRRTRTGAGRR